MTSSNLFQCIGCGCLLCLSVVQEGWAQSVAEGVFEKSIQATGTQQCSGSSHHQYYASQGQQKRLRLYLASCLKLFSLKLNIAQLEVQGVLKGFGLEM